MIEVRVASWNSDMGSTQHNSSGTRPGRDFGACRRRARQYLRARRALSGALRRAACADVVARGGCSRAASCVLARALPRSRAALGVTAA
ncbi:MAG: hypothetical protein KC468_19725, partial [Myxococcales bacterium]|nr:hypothetical protein [Myxococcales bacterium]